MDLDFYRKEIDRIDFELIKLIKERLLVIEKIALFKKENNLLVRDKEREKTLLEDRIRKTNNLGIDSVFIKKIFKDIIQHSRKKQNAIINIL